MAKEKATVQTPDYIKALLQPIPERATDRRVWSIPLAGVWVPFYTATNAMGETAISADVLGAPLRLAKEADGTPRFSKSGRPVLRVVKDMADQVRIARETFTASLLSYVDTVQKGMPDAFKAQVERARKEGDPINQKMHADLADYLAAQTAKDDGHAPAEAEKELVPA